jgi:hypothetical protein
MEGQLWSAILTILARVDKRQKRAGEDYSDEEIVKTFYWSVIHDRPMGWACEARNWPLHARRTKRPSQSTVSRRLRTASVIQLLDAVEQRVTWPADSDLYWMIDGKPLMISGCSKDRQAGYGRAAGCKAKGYKLHAIVVVDGAVAAWRIVPMNKDERMMGARLLKTAKVQGYVVADANYDSTNCIRFAMPEANSLLRRGVMAPVAS